MKEEKRHFTRIPFNASAIIINSRTGQKYRAEIIDISLKGVLIRRPDNWEGSNDEHCTVHLQLAGNEAEVNLAVISIHSEHDKIGFQTQHMDLDTATHLHRLLELNLGDEKLLQRELSELITSN